jgi:hypothetical protein
MTVLLVCFTARVNACPSGSVATMLQRGLGAKIQGTFGTGKEETQIPFGNDRESFPSGMTEKA